jgi:hypothetical protein
LTTASLPNAEQRIELDRFDEWVSGCIADFQDFERADRRVRRGRANLVVANGESIP